MSNIKYITESDIPFNESFLMIDRFQLLNMWTEGIWYVDILHPKYQDIKTTALNIAITFGDKEQIEKLTP